MLSLILLVGATSANAGDRPLPWSGGAGRVTPLERTTSRIASSLAAKDVGIECVDARGWSDLGARNGFDPALVWALTPLAIAPGSESVRADDVSSFAPRTCRLIEAFSTAPTEMGSRLCRHVVRTTAATRARSAARTGARTQRILVGECDDWASKLLAVHVLTHESMHLAGVVDEAEADCLATQLDAYVATQLGGSAAFAGALAREYWTLYYPAQDRTYTSKNCRNGGPLDLFRGNDGWPTPSRYPSELGSVIASFTTARILASP